MATPKTQQPESTKIKKTTTSKAIKAAPAAPAPAPVVTHPATISGHTNRKNARLDGKNIETVTALKLRRQLLTGDVAHVPGFYMSDADFTALSMIMVKNKITLDEILRGCVTSVLASSDPETCLRNYIPLMN